MSVDVVLIAGPTASGKSAAALALAERVNGAIINADSMQVYSELAILTARPSAADEARAPHDLYGHVSVRERYSAGRYQDEAAAALARARERGHVAIFAGGTGLYFDVLTKGLSPIPPVPSEIRAAIRRDFETMGRDSFIAELERRDASILSRVRPSDTQRLLRAAEVLQATGKPLSEWQAIAPQPVLSGLRVSRFVLALPREVLTERIDCRFEAMMSKGALEEARALVGLDPSLPAAKALGLPQLWRLLTGDITPETAISETQMATKKYVKRQLTWFRSRMQDWRWLEDGDSSNIISSMTRDES